MSVIGIKLWVGKQDFFESMVEDGTITEELKDMSFKGVGDVKDRFAFKFYDEGYLWVHFNKHKKESIKMVLNTFDTAAYDWIHSEK